MEEWVAYYKQYEALILGVFFWLLSIPTGVFINRLDTYLKNRSKTKKVREILTHYADVMRLRTELRSRPPDYKFEMTVTMKILILTFVISMVQALSSNAVADMYGEKASDLYYWITLFLLILLNAGAIAYGTKQDNIFDDAVFFKKYREKTITKLAQLGYGSGVLAKIDTNYGIE